MSDIFREVEDEVRQERYLQLWQAYGKYVIGLVIAIVVGSGGWLAYQSYEQDKRDTAARLYLSAVDALATGDLEAAAAQFATVAEETGGTYEGLAQMQRAAALRRLGRIGEARAAYLAVAENGDVSEELRGLARLHAAGLDADDATLEEIRTSLGSLLTEESPWRPFARELEGYVALRAGDYDTARERFSALAVDLSIAAPVRERAAALLQGLPRADEEAAVPVEDLAPADPLDEDAGVPGADIGVTEDPLPGIDATGGDDRSADAPPSEGGNPAGTPSEPAPEANGGGR